LRDTPEEKEASDLIMKLMLLAYTPEEHGKNF
jgi:hypothetical protein